MAIYKISDILHIFKAMEKEGYEYVELSELPPEDDEPASLNIDAIQDESSSESDFLDAVELPKGYIWPGMLE